MPSSLPKWLQAADDGGLSVSEEGPAFSQDGKVPVQPARAPALGWPPSTPGGTAVLYVVVLRENSQTILGISLSPCPHPSLAPQGPFQESHLVLQLCVMTPSLVKEWPSVLHDQLLLGTCRGTAKDI